MSLNPYSQHLAWLLTMARNPGFKAHAWHRAKELEADPSGLWLGITQALTQGMKDAGPATQAASVVP